MPPPGGHGAARARDDEQMQIFMKRELAAEGFSALAAHLLGEPRASQPLRRQAAGNGLGALSAHVLRAELGGMQLLSAQQLEAIFHDLALDKEGDGLERDKLVELGRFFESCFLGRLELLRRKFRAHCFGSGSEPALSLGADYTQFREQARRSGLSADSMRESELRQLFEFIDEGRRGRLEPERFDEIIGMELERSLTTESSAELIAPLLLRIAAALDRRGEEGLAALSHLQRLAPVSGYVAREPFRQELRQLGVPLSQIDAELLYVLLDRASDGTVCMEQLLATVSRHAKTALVSAELGTSSPTLFASAAVDPETPTLKVHRQRSTVKRSRVTPAQKSYSAGLVQRSDPEPEPEHELLRGSRKLSLIRGRRASRQSRGVDSDRSEEDEADLVYEGDRSWDGGMELRELVRAAHDERLDGSDLEGVAQGICDRTNVPAMRTRVRNSGGVRALVEVLRRGNTGARVVAARALATLGADGDRHQDELAQSGAVRFLVQMLEERQWATGSFTLRADPHEDNACGAAPECVAVIAYGSVPNASALGQSGAIDGVVRALRKRGGLRTKAILCLAALVDSAANRPLVAGAGSIPLLLRCSQDAAEDQDEEGLGQVVSLLQSLALTRSCQTQLVDYSASEALEACVAALHLPVDSRSVNSARRLIEQLSASLADERQRRAHYEIEWDTQPVSNWSVGALASWVASVTEVGLPEHAQSFRRLDVDGQVFVATLGGSTERTVSELWQELGVVQRRDRTLILDAMRSRGQSMSAQASLLSATVSGDYDATGAKRAWDRRYPRLCPALVVRAFQEIFWVQKFRLARRYLGSWRRQKQILRMLLPLYILYHMIPWLLAPAPLPVLSPPPPPPPGLITEILGLLTGVMFAQLGWAEALLFWTVVTVPLLYRTRSACAMCETLVRCGLERVRATFRHSPRRYYRCVASRPVALTVHADPSPAGSDGASYFTATTDPVCGHIVPGELIEVLEFRVASSTGRLRARVRHGWADLVSAQGVRLLEDVVVLPQEHCFITVLAEKRRRLPGLLRRVQDAVAVRPSPSPRSAEWTGCMADDYSDNDTLQVDLQDILATRASFGTDEVRLTKALCVRAIPATADRPLENARSAHGCVVVVDRGGGAPFVTKARHAQTAGAIGVIIINGTDEPLTAHGHRHLDGTLDVGADVAIPIVCVRKTGGEMLVARLPAVVNMDEMEVAGDRSDTW